MFFPKLKAAYAVSNYKINYQDWFSHFGVIELLLNCKYKNLRGGLLNSIFAFVITIAVTLVYLFHF